MVPGSSILHRLLSHGYVLVKNVVSEDECNRLIALSKGHLDLCNEWDVVYANEHPELKFEKFKTAVLDELLRRKIGAQHGTNQLLSSVDSIRVKRDNWYTPEHADADEIVLRDKFYSHLKTPSDNILGSSVLDLEPLGVVAQVFLTDCSDMAFRDHSHMFGIPKLKIIKNKSKLKKTKSELQNTPWTRVSAHVGDILLIHWYVFHKAFPNKSGTDRMSADFRFFMSIPDESKAIIRILRSEMDSGLMLRQKKKSSKVRQPFSKRYPDVKLSIDYLHSFAELLRLLGNCAGKSLMQVNGKLLNSDTLLVECPQSIFLWDKIPVKKHSAEEAFKDMILDLFVSKLDLSYHDTNDAIVIDSIHILSTRNNKLDEWRERAASKINGALSELLVDEIYPQDIVSNWKEFPSFELSQKSNCNGEYFLNAMVFRHLFWRAGLKEKAIDFGKDELCYVEDLLYVWKRLRKNSYSIAVEKLGMVDRNHKLIYIVTHLIFILSDWMKFRLPQDLFQDEIRFFQDCIQSQKNCNIVKRNPEYMCEMAMCFMILGLETDAQNCISTLVETLKGYETQSFDIELHVFWCIAALHLGDFHKLPSIKDAAKDSMPNQLFTDFCDLFSKDNDHIIHNAAAVSAGENSVDLSCDDVGCESDNEENDVEDIDKIIDISESTSVAASSSSLDSNCCAVVGTNDVATRKKRSLAEFSQQQQDEQMVLFHGRTFGKNSHVLIGKNHIAGQGVIHKLRGSCHGHEIRLGYECSLVLTTIFDGSYPLTHGPNFLETLSDVGEHGICVISLAELRLVGQDKQPRKKTKVLAKSKSSIPKELSVLSSVSSSSSSYSEMESVGKFPSYSDKRGDNSDLLTKRVEKLERAFKIVREMLPPQKQSKLDWFLNSRNDDLDEDRSISSEDGIKSAKDKKSSKDHMEFVKLTKQVHDQFHLSGFNLSRGIKDTSNREAFLRLYKYFPEIDKRTVYSITHTYLNSQKRIKRDSRKGTKFMKEKRQKSKREQRRNKVKVNRISNLPILYKRRSDESIDNMLKGVNQAELNKLLKKTFIHSEYESAKENDDETVYMVKSPPWRPKRLTMIVRKLDEIQDVIKAKERQNRATGRRGSTSIRRVLSNNPSSKPLTSSNREALQAFLKSIQRTRDGIDPAEQ